MKTRTLTIILIILAASLLANPANRFEPEIVDARSAGLGGCSLLSSQGSNALFYNPSAIASLDSKNLQLSSRYSSGTYDFKYSIDSDYAEFSSADYKGHFMFNGIALSLPVDFTSNLKGGLGIGYRNYYDQNFNLKKTTKHYDEGITEGISKYDIESRGGLNNIVIGGGLNFTDKLQIGATISLPFLCDTSDDREREWISVDEDRDYMYITNSEGSMKGSFLTISGTYRLSEKFVIALRYREEFKLDYENTTIREDDDDIDFDIDKYEITIPAEIDFAAAYTPLSKFKLIAEYITRNFDDYKVNYNQTNGSSNPGYSFRSGIEIGSQTMLRLGCFVQSVPLYKYNPNHNNDYFGYNSYFYPNPETELGFTAGLGFKIGKNITADFFGSYSTINYDQRYYDDDDWREGIVSIDTEYTNFKLGGTIGLSF